MADLPTRLDLFAIGRAYLLSRARRIDPGEVDVLGSDANLFVGSSSVIASVAIRQLTYAIGRFLLATATDEDLDRLAFDRYGEARKGASPATGYVRLWRTTATAGAGSLPIGTKITSLSGADYVTTTVANFGPTDLVATSLVGVVAVQAGKVTQVGANYLRKFSTPGALFDSTIQVTNDKPTAGGEDREDDETFRSRLRNFWLSARRGTGPAIEYGALTVPGVVSAMAIEALEGVNPARIVNLFISDSSGVASAQMVAAVQVALADYRAAGITVIVWPSTPSLVSVLLRLSFLSGVDTVALATNVVAAIVEYINSLPVNAALRVKELAAVLVRYKQDGLVITDDSIVAPAGDIIPLPGQTLRATLTTVTAEAA